MSVNAGSLFEHDILSVVVGGTQMGQSQCTAGRSLYKAEAALAMGLWGMLVRRHPNAELSKSLGVLDLKRLAFQIYKAAFAKVGRLR